VQSHSQRKPSHVIVLDRRRIVFGYRPFPFSIVQLSYCLACQTQKRFTIPPGISSPMHLRTMTRKDIPAGLRLNELAGWNQTAADWNRFLDASPEGCFVAEIDGQVRGTTTTISFENRFAWVSMVLVDSEYRGRGVGTRLLERAIAYLDDRKVPTIKLDATPQGLPIYQKLGFVAEYEIARWILRRSSGETAETILSPRTRSSESLTQESWESICKADRELFGADRSLLLQSLQRETPDLTTTIWCAGTLDGYAFARRGYFADHFGPAIARDAGTTFKLLEGFLTRSRRETLIADCPRSNRVASDLLKSGGFVYSRPLTRMYRGSNDHAGQPELICAIAGPEFG
jgi:GNAT superfamily N-acetyltransferase